MRGGECTLSAKWPSILPGRMMETFVVSKGAIELPEAGCRPVDCWELGRAASKIGQSSTISVEQVSASGAQQAVAHSAMLAEWTGAATIATARNRPIFARTFIATGMLVIKRHLRQHKTDMRICHDSCGRDMTYGWPT